MARGRTYVSVLFGSMARGRTYVSVLFAGLTACGRIAFDPLTGASGDGDLVGDGDLLGDGALAADEVMVPAGAFMMGCNSAIDTMCGSEELPYHSVMLSAYAIDRYEVTQLAYSACVDAAACAPPTIGYDPIGLADYPVTSLTWDQSRTYCEWRGRRLPTEAEWEKAARGTDGRIFPWGNTNPTCELAAAGGCPGNTQPVGSHPLGASPYAAMDMAGNVYEWANDYFGVGYYSTSPTSDPHGPASGSLRIVRGGDYTNSAVYLRASYRGANNPATTSTDYGIRCARSLP